jgi:N-acetylglucosaminyldiphosphoundecaprenol N-acetyl-beta-D-mannosaminyltransferase
MTTMSPPENSISSIRILGLPVHDVDMKAALEQMDGFIRSRSPHHIVTADASMLVLAQADEALRAIILHADLVTPDSVGVLWAARRQKRPLRERVSGVELVESLCAASVQRGYRMYFLGGAPGVAGQAADRMRARYPGADIVGARHGFFRDEETEAIVDEIRSTRPDILCVAFGIPTQEKWIARHRERLEVPLLIGVGGTFDVLSGNTRRAPRLMRKARLEWLWRVLANPRKINKVLLLPRFVLLVQRASRH